MEDEHKNDGNLGKRSRSNEPDANPSASKEEKVDAAPQVNKGSLDDFDENPRVPEQKASAPETHAELQAKLAKLMKDAKERYVDYMDDPTNNYNIRSGLRDKLNRMSKIPAGVNAPIIRAAFNTADTTGKPIVYYTIVLPPVPELTTPRDFHCLIEVPGLSGPVTIEVCASSGYSPTSASYTPTSPQYAAYAAPPAVPKPQWRLKFKLTASLPDGLWSACLHNDGNLGTSWGDYDGQDDPQYGPERSYDYDHLYWGVYWYDPCGEPLNLSLSVRYAAMMPAVSVDEKTADKTLITLRHDGKEYTVQQCVLAQTCPQLATLARHNKDGVLQLHDDVSESAMRLFHRHVLTDGGPMEPFDDLDADTIK